MRYSWGLILCSASLALFPAHAFAADAVTDARQMVCDFAQDICPYAQQTVGWAPLAPNIFGLTWPNGSMQLNTSLRVGPVGELALELLHESTHRLDFAHGTRYWRDGCFTMESRAYTNGLQFWRSLYGASTANWPGQDDLERNMKQMGNDFPSGIVDARRFPFYQRHCA